MKKLFFIAIAINLFSMFYTGDSTKATTVIKKSFEQVTQESQMIFEGIVLSKETRLSPTNNTPFTYFSFEIIDVVKGEYNNQTIEIGFMGGPKGDLFLEISDMQMPEVGERGFYFVKTLSEQHVHPLAGWDQGHYLVIENDQNKTNFVIPVMNRENLFSLPRSARQLTAEDFKEKIRKVIESE